MTVSLVEAWPPAPPQPPRIAVGPAMSGQATSMAGADAPVGGAGATPPEGGELPPEDGYGVKISDITTTRFFSASRNISRGWPSISTLPRVERSCGGQLWVANRRRPDRTKMRLPSFFTKSASSTPFTWVLVVV